MAAKRRRPLKAIPPPSKSNIVKFCLNRPRIQRRASVFAEAPGASVLVCVSCEGSPDSAGSTVRAIERLETVSGGKATDDFTFDASEAMP